VNAKLFSAIVTLAKDEACRKNYRKYNAYAIRNADEVIAGEILKTLPIPKRTMKNPLNSLKGDFKMDKLK